MLGTLGRLAIRIITLALALWCAISCVPGINLAMPPHTLVGDGHYDYYVVFLLAGAVLYVVQATVGKVLRIISLPFTILTLGLFLLVVNAVTLLVASEVAHHFGIGLTVDSFWDAVISSVIISIVTAIVGVITD